MDGEHDETAGFTRRRRWFLVHATSTGLTVACMIAAATFGLLVLLGLGGVALIVAGVAGFRAERTLIRSGPILDGYVGDDRYIDGAPLDTMNTVALYGAIFGGLVFAISGFAFGANQILVLLGR